MNALILVQKQTSVMDHMYIFVTDLFSRELIYSLRSNMTLIQKVNLFLRSYYNPFGFMLNLPRLRCCSHCP